jgi:hypothetical protein
MKVRCLYGEHVEEHIVNLGDILAMQYELRKNTMGTNWQTGQNETKKYPSRPPNLKGIKPRHLGPSHWLKGK